MELLRCGSMSFLIESASHSRSESSPSGEISLYDTYYTFFWFICEPQTLFYHIFRFLSSVLFKKRTQKCILYFFAKNHRVSKAESTKNNETYFSCHPERSEAESNFFRLRSQTSLRSVCSSLRSEFDCAQDDVDEKSAEQSEVGSTNNQRTMCAQGRLSRPFCSAQDDG